MRKEVAKAKLEAEKEAEKEIADAKLKAKKEVSYNYMRNTNSTELRGSVSDQCPITVI